MEKYRKLLARENAAPNFFLSVLEGENIPFTPVRCYWLYGSKNEKSSGAHAHIIEKELFVIVQGSCTVIIDRGRGLERIEIKGPTDVLYVGNGTWHQVTEMSEDAVLVILTSTLYNPNRLDYISDYETYLKIRENLLATP